MSPQEIGRRLRAARERRGWTLKNVEARCSISGAQVHNVEHGRKASDDAYHQVAQALGMTFHVARDLTPAGVEVTSILVSPELAEDWASFHAQAPPRREMILSIIRALLTMDDYHVSLIAGQIEVFARIQRERGGGAQGSGRT